MAAERNPFINSLREENERLSSENDELRRNLELIRRNSCLRTANIIAAIIKLFDENGGGLQTLTIEALKGAKSSDEANFRPVTPTIQQVTSQSNQFQSGYASAGSRMSASDVNNASVRVKPPDVDKHADTPRRQTANAVSELDDAFTFEIPTPLRVSRATSRATNESPDQLLAEDFSRNLLRSNKTIGNENSNVATKRGSLEQYSFDTTKETAPVEDLYSKFLREQQQHNEQQKKHGARDSLISQQQSQAALTTDSVCEKFAEEQTRSKRRESNAQASPRCISNASIAADYSRKLSEQHGQRRKSIVQVSPRRVSIASPTEEYSQKSAEQQQGQRRRELAQASLQHVANLANQVVESSEKPRGALQNSQRQHSQASPRIPDESVSERFPEDPRTTRRRKSVSQNSIPLSQGALLLRRPSIQTDLESQGRPLHGKAKPSISAMTGILQNTRSSVVAIPNSVSSTAQLNSLLDTVSTKKSDPFSKTSSSMYGVDQNIRTSDGEMRDSGSVSYTKPTISAQRRWSTVKRSIVKDAPPARPIPVSTSTPVKGDRRASISPQWSAAGRPELDNIEKIELPSLGDRRASISPQWSAAGRPELDNIEEIEQPSLANRRRSSVSPRWVQAGNYEADSNMEEHHQQLARRRSSLSPRWSKPSDHELDHIYEDQQKLEEATLPADLTLRPVDSILGYDARLTNEDVNRANSINVSKRLVGEIAFQLDRRILHYVFCGEDDDNEDLANKKRRYYGYTLSNIDEKIRKEASDRDGNVDAHKELAMRYRFSHILESLAPLGYTIDIHGEFALEMVNKYGLLNSPPEKKTLQNFGLNDPRMLRLLVYKLMTRGDRLTNVLIVLDCLCFLSYEDNEPIFKW